LSLSLSRKPVKLNAGTAERMDVRTLRARGEELRNVGSSKIVILGGGFGGIYVAQHLLSCCLPPKQWEVNLINCNPHFEFKPLLPDVLAGRLPPKCITTRLDSLWTSENYHVRVAVVTGVDLKKHIVKTTGGNVDYDYLVIALGAAPGVVPADRGARLFFCESLDDCLRLREHVLPLMATSTTKLPKRTDRKRRTIAVIGAGPTGIEVACELTHMLNGQGNRGETTGGRATADIVLIESSSHILSTWGRGLRKPAEDTLKHVGVRLLTGTTVKRIAKGVIRLNGGRILRADTVIWSGGLRGLPLYRSLGTPLDADDRIRVMPTLRLPGHPNVFALGDAVSTGAFSTPVPQSAQAAHQQAGLVADNIRNSIEERPLRTFHYRELGVVLPIGGRRAIASIMGFTLNGHTAWVLEKALFLARIPGLTNKLSLLDAVALEPLADRGRRRLGWPQPA